ncbi:hypothetical protein KR51_00019530 [Rubidibacter lacunae KORDI 51-2]|uniref:Ribosome maturation factor RimP n=1 Tax=Rubidibacter lacunae KORDI 51-2 TaxID=582515 RepID=U5DNV0_9CHRO|nr:ribosome maturation factor RimP [Rubidibacter lacunae]ERN41385.1 hypothetical protein KR51_00019530 [Rubidibacter lacunae KORDI 51-2]
MTHPSIAPIQELAAPLAAELGLEIVNLVFQTNYSPPVLRVDVRNLGTDTGLDDCERMSRALEDRLDTSGLIPDAYVLEVSSPGLSSELACDRDFISFKGFPVRISTHEPYKGKTQWRGRLQKRDETAVYINQKGRVTAIPRDAIASVELDEES